MDDGEQPSAAARSWLQNNPQVLDGWLEGVSTVDGEEGLPAVKQALNISE